MNRSGTDDSHVADRDGYAAIYARVSTEDQSKGFSIPTQIQAGQKLAEREGYTVPEASILIDEGISGTTIDRFSLRKLRDLVNTRTIQAAIVYDPDRLSRNLWRLYRDRLLWEMATGEPSAICGVGPFSP
jgi:DNA invertase Pin-like site-specific DNA recombinase